MDIEKEKAIKNLNRNLSDQTENQEAAKELLTELGRTLTNKFAAFLVGLFMIMLTAGLAIALSAYLIRKALGY